MSRSASERLWHIWFFLQFSNVYTGNREFLEKCVFFRDGDDDFVFASTVCEWLQTGIVNVVQAGGKISRPDGLMRA
jgi:hypothetical protein